MTELKKTLAEGRRSFAAAAVFVLGVSLGLPASEAPVPRTRDVSAPPDHVCLLQSTAEQDADGPTVVPASVPLALQLGDDVPPAVRARMITHLRSTSTAPDIVTADAPPSAFEPDALVLAVGDTSMARALIAPEELETLPDEGFVLRSGTVEQRSVIAVDGNGTSRKGVHDVGATYGAYALLEQLGFGFLHPLEPTPPSSAPARLPVVDRVSSPRWPIRGLQLHTMHPLELTDLLQGWGPGGPDDEAGWRAMLKEWDAFLEWMVANGQNRVHWVWLAADSWRAFADSTERIERVKLLVDRAHAFGIEVGLDVPLRLQQQNAARLVRESSNLADEKRQIEKGVAHVMEAGFDYLVTESGTTEVTAPEARRMLEWMNAMTRTAADEHGVPTFIKVHASTGQYAEGFDDPNTGEAINFNFLPHHADSRLGVLPHTVQHYALDDPAPTYGNEGFAHIRAFLQEQAGRRPTVWHPETAYWVSFDNDVPLFLPVYASRRVRDLRLLAGDEDAGRMGRGEHAGASMDGQLTFSSGWEWGYWLQEVVTARAAWNPHVSAATDEDALRAHLAPVARVFGDAGEPLVDWIIEYADVQKRLLIEGRVGGDAPSDIVRRNGQAYLQGFETWDDVADLLADEAGLTHGRMQPDRVDFDEMRDANPDTFEAEVAPLLNAMANQFDRLLKRLLQMRDTVPANALTLYEEFVDAARITALRARQVRALYASVHAASRGRRDASAEHLQRAQDALDRGLAVVAHRETHYRVPSERIAGWRDNPTVYPFTYLWTVRSLYYWQRDEALAIGVSDSPCLFNIIDPVDVGLGDGTVSDLADGVAGGLAAVPGFGEIAECMRAPDDEPRFLPVRWPAARSSSF